ncbi:MAG: hypothetical protein KOO60_01635 [Gemmatimonadales bacterium]|nr:hypothetical protein [Gemmatimonadales bacterium]
MKPYDFDDDLQIGALSDGRLRVRVLPWPSLAVVIGRGGKPSLELNTENIANDEVPVYRRPGGGCAVVLDPGNVIVSVALPLPGIGGIKSAFSGLSNWLISALADCGVPDVRQQGVSDLAIPHSAAPGSSSNTYLKIGGSCIYRTRDLLYYSTTLLVDPELDLMDRYLPYPPREPDYRAGRSHRHFMGSLQKMGLVGSAEELARALESKLESNSPGGSTGEDAGRTRPG